MENELKHIMSQLTLNEKIALLSGKDFWHLKGIERLNLPSIMVTDGPHGLRKQSGSADHVGLGDSVPSTCFPTASGLASTWNVELIQLVGETLGEECLAEGVSVLLGPGCNLKRHPLCGRNFEYFSEDPLLSGTMAAALINGLQSKGIGASLKHYVANNQETNRMITDAIIDQRTLHDLYLKSFEIAIKESQPWTVMSAYNKVNGVYMAEHEALLHQLLRNTWSFQGVVMTDWGGNNDRVKGLIAANDLEMPSSGGAHDLVIKRALEKGLLSERHINECVERIVSLILKSRNTLQRKKPVIDTNAHHHIARSVAAETMVLLKNDNQILPIKANEKIALIGTFAKQPRYQGSGSSLIKPTQLSSAYESFKRLKNYDVLYAPGYSIQSDLIEQPFIDEALNIANKADKVILMVGLTDVYESEGFDRTHLELPPNHTALIEAIAKQHKQVVVVLSNGAPVSMPWKDNISGILEMYLAGQASGEALVDVLTGSVNPSGKLAETFPNRLEELPSNQSFPGDKRQVQYREGLYVGYRAYDSMNIEPLFPFGFGLSYTTFEINDIRLNRKTLTIEDTLTVTVTLSNTGGVDGQEVIQLYISKQGSKLYRPQKELKAFKKVFLKKGVKETIELQIPMNCLTITQDDQSVLESGQYTLHVGTSSRTIHETIEITIVSNHTIKTDTSIVYQTITKHFRPTEQDFEFNLTHRIPETPKLRPYHMNTTIGEIKHHFIGKKLYTQVVKQFASMGGETVNDGTKKMFERMIEEMPFRNLVAFSSGDLSLRRAQGLLDLINKKYIRGFIKVVFK